MSAHFISLLSARPFRLAWVCLLAVQWMGCSYFRWGDPSYSEIQKRTQEEKAADKMNFDPKTVFEKKEEP
jgi:hypothetical protein